MTPEEAAVTMMPLVAALDFNDDSVEQWLGWIEKMHDVEAAHVAAEQLAQNARTRKVPGFAVYRDLYDAATRRLEEAREWEGRQLTMGNMSRERVVAPAEGIKIAWEAYENECYRQKREPNKEYFASITDPWARQARRDSVSKRGAR